MSDDERGSKYKLKISIISAANLRAADINLIGTAKSDPYCICSLLGRPDTQIKTETVMKSLDPVWNFEGVIDNVKFGDSLFFKVMDYDAIGDDDLLGDLTLSFNQFHPGGIDEDVTLNAETKPGKLPATIKLRIFAERIHLPISDTRCFVSVLRAEGLRGADRNLLSSASSDPYCIVSIPGKRKSTWRTKTIFKNLNPEWNEEDEMQEYQAGDNLEFTVFDYDVADADDLLGQVTLQSTDFHPHGYDGELDLGEGTVHVKVEVTVPEIIEEVIDPGEHVGPRDREPAPFQLRSLDTGRTHRLVAYTRIGRSKRMMEPPIDLVLDSPGILDVSRVHAIIKCWRGPDPNVWMARIYDQKGSEGAGMGPGGGHAGGGTTVDGERVDPVLGTGLDIGCVLRFGVREMWSFERAAMHLRSADAEIACNRANQNANEDPSRMRALRVPSLAVDSALQRCPDWLSLVRVVLECRLEPDEPPCVDVIETQDEVGRTVGRHEAPTLELQANYPVKRILREVVIGGSIKLRLSSDPKLLAPVLDLLQAIKRNNEEILESRADALD